MKHLGYFLQGQNYCEGSDCKVEDSCPKLGLGNLGLKSSVFVHPTSFELLDSLLPNLYVGVSSLAQYCLSHLLQHNGKGPLNVWVVYLGL